MAKLVAIATNYLTITDTVSSLLEFEGPLKDVRYIRLPDSKIRIYLDGERTNHSPQLTSDDSVFEDAGGAITIYDYLKANTGFNTASGGSDAVDEDALAPQFKGTSVIAGTEIDWLLSQVYTKTLAGNTVFTFANIFIGVKDLELTGNFTLGFPANFKVISGTYDGTVANLIEIICTDAGTPAGWIVISQEA